MSGSEVLEGLPLPPRPFGAARCAWRGPSLSTAAPDARSQGAERKDLPIRDRKGIFSPGKFPLLPSSARRQGGGRGQSILY